MKIQRLAAVTMVLAACLVGAGCQGGGGGGGASTGSDNAGGGSAKKVPQDARRVAEATGSRVIHRPLREGTIYVTEVQSAGDGRETVKVLHSGPVRAGANVVIDPAADAITVNDQQVKSVVHLQQGKTYRLYFLQK